MSVPIPVLGTVFYEPIRAVRIQGAGTSTPSVRRMPEANGLTTQIGVPFMLNNAGFQVEWTTGAGNPQTVFGVSTEPGHNLTQSGVGQSTSEVAPPNQPNALTIPVGAHMRLGDIGLYQADGNNVFSAALKFTTLPTTGFTGASQVFSNSLIQPGVYYSLVKDTAGFAAQGVAASNFWYVDTSVTNGNSAVVQLLGFDPSSPNDGVNGTRVFFQFKSSQRYFV